MYPLNYSFEAGRKKTYQLFHLAEICPKKGKNILYISPILYSSNNTRPLSRFGKISSIGPSEISKGGNPFQVTKRQNPG